MNFSELFKHSGQLCKFSPDGKFLANIVQYRLIVRDVKTLQIVHLYTCLDAVQHVEWSSDSLFILCGMYKRNLVQVWSLEESEWTCKIDEGSAGLVSACWSPDARHILTTAEFNLRVTVWSLVNKSVSYIKYPKPCQKGLDFSKDGRYLALAERRDCKDFISVFVTSSWQLVKHFEPATEDLAGVQWSPDGRVMCVWESMLQYKILLYSLDGRCLETFSAYDLALGIKSVAWAPSSQFLAVGSFDEKVRILNHLTWRTVAEHHHPASVSAADSAMVVYKECELKRQIPETDLLPPQPSMFTSQSKYEIIEGTERVPTIKPDLNKANPKLGVGTVMFSSDCRYLYTKNDNMPTALWIWDMVHLTQCACLVQAAPIKCVSWDPCQPRLALCCGNNRIYMWSPAGCLSVEVPAEANFQVNSLRWHPHGNALLLIGRDDMCMCFLTDPANPDDP